jgi:solute carrier family 25 protein 38
MSGALISACVQPLDVLRTRMQGDAAQGASRGTLATLRLVVKESGLRRAGFRA